MAQLNSPSIKLHATRPPTLPLMIQKFAYLLVWSTASHEVLQPPTSNRSSYLGQQISGPNTTLRTNPPFHSPEEIHSHATAIHNTYIRLSPTVDPEFCFYYEAFLSPFDDLVAHMISHTNDAAELVKILRYEKGEEVICIDNSDRQGCELRYQAFQVSEDHSQVELR